MIGNSLVSPLVAGLVVLSSGPALAGKVTGRVLVAERPAPGARVAAIPWESPYDEARRQARGAAEPAPLAETTADEAGVFTLAVPGSPKGELVFRVRVGAKGAVSASPEVLYLASESAEAGDLPLRVGAPLSGRVTGPAGRAVAGARVTLRAIGPFEATIASAAIPQVVTSAEDGSFRFESAARKGNVLVVEGAGFGTALLYELEAGPVARPVSLRPGAVVEGVVKRRDGSPAAGALVRYESGRLETRWVEAGPDGAFRLVDLPSGTGSVVADAGDGGMALARGLFPGRTARLALTLSPPASLEGRTLDAESRRPVPRVRLSLSGSGGLLQARSGPDGRYRFGSVRPGEVSLRADEPGHVLFNRGGLPVGKGEMKTLDVLLTRGASLTGRVVDEQGSPVAGARGAVGRSIPSQFALRIAEIAGDLAGTIRTRPDGTFTASRLMPGEGQKLIVTHPEYESAFVGGLTLAPGRAGGNLVVRLRRGLTLAGTVRDEEGRPVAGADVELGRSRTVRRAQSAGFASTFGDPAPVKCGAEGAFEIRGIPPGDYFVAAKAPGRATEVVDPVSVSRDAKPAPLSIVLRPGASISGAVRRKTGEGAEGWLLIPKLQASGQGLGPEYGLFRSGADGTFLVDGLRVGERYDVQLVESSSFAYDPGPVKRGLPAPSAGVEFVVAGLGRIEGAALDARTGRPLTAFEVSYQPDRGVPFVRRVQGSSPGASVGPGEALAVDAADGRFALDEVPTGTWHVVVSAKGYQVARAGGIVVEEGTTTEGVELRLSAGALLRGRVRDAKSGRPVPDASVGVTSDGAQPAAGLGFPGNDVVTDADGRFEAEGITPGTLTVSVSHRGYVTRVERKPLGEAGGTIEVALVRGESLEGTVFAETRQSVAGARVALLESGGASRGGGDASAFTDASGRFGFDRLAPGRYTVRAELGTAASPPVESVVVEGQPLPDVTLVLAEGAMLRGRVAGLPEGTRWSVFVIANGPNSFGGRTPTDAEGRFEFRGLPVGRTSLRATATDLAADSSRSAAAEVTVNDGEREVAAELVFEGNSTLAGRVSRGGEAVPGARVSVQGRRPGMSASGRTDESGAYRLQGLLAGEYNLDVTSPSGLPGGSLHRKVNVEGASTHDVEFPVARFAGRVVDAQTGKPIGDAGILATAEGSAGGGGGNGISDSNGKFDVENVAPGPYTLTVRRVGYEPASGKALASEEGGDAGTIEMKRGGGLEIRVVDGLGGFPLRSAGLRVKNGATLVSSGRVPLDTEGRGSLPFSLPPGKYTLVVDSNGYSSRVVANAVVPGPPLEIALTPGGTLEIRPGEVSRAKGEAKVLDLLGQPYPFRSFVAEGALILPSSGVATLTNLAPGSYTLAVEGVAPKVFTVTEGGRTVVELP